MKLTKTILSAQLALIGILLCISAPAWANLAANTQIINSADLSYFDGAKTQHATATVTVTVSLVSGAPTIDKGGPYTTSYSGCGTTLIDSFLITAGSNGPAVCERDPAERARHVRISSHLRRWGPGYRRDGRGGY